MENITLAHVVALVVWCLTVLIIKVIHKEFK